MAESELIPRIRCCGKSGDQTLQGLFVGFKSSCERFVSFRLELQGGLALHGAIRKPSFRFILHRTVSRGCYTWSLGLEPRAKPDSNKPVRSQAYPGPIRKLPPTPSLEFQTLEASNSSTPEP